MADPDYMGALMHALPGSMVAPWLQHQAQGFMDKARIPGDTAIAGYGGYQQSPKEMIPGAMQLSSMGPQASAPGAVAGAVARGGVGAADPTLAALFLKDRSSHLPPGSTELRAGEKYYHILDDAKPEGGNTVGTTRVYYRPDTNDLQVNAIRTNQPSPLEKGNRAVKLNPNAHALGHEDIRGLLTQLKGEYPDAQTITGLRMSGANAGVMKTMKMPTTPEEKAWELAGQGDFSKLSPKTVEQLRQGVLRNIQKE